MSPFEYLHQYHNFACVDPRLGLNVSAAITGYDNTVASAGNAQFGLLCQMLSKKYFRWAALPPVFYIPNEPKIDATEEFILASIKRAFVSRGSPDEMRDALRLAVLVGLCPPQGAAAYAVKWFKNDCVSFAGNYCGVSSSTAVYGYAEGFTSNQLSQKGVAPDVKLSADVIRIPPRGSMEEVSQCDLLLTFGHADSRGLPWRHIAVVESFTPVSGTHALVSIAEWGAASAAAHITRNKNVEIHDGSKAEDKEVYRLLLGRQSKFRDWNAGVDKFVCFNGKAPDGSKALRVFFNADSFNFIESRGWDVAGKRALQ